MTILKEEYLKKFRRMVYEYTTPADTVSEDAPAADPNAMAVPAVDPNVAMGVNPNAMATDPNMMGADPNAMAMSAADPNAMATDPNMMGVQPQDAGAPGFAPEQGGQEIVSEPQGQDTHQGEEQTDAEVSNVSNVEGEIQDFKDNTEKTLDSLTGKFEDLLSKFDDALAKIDDTDAKIASLSNQIRDMNPTPEQKMTIRSLEGKPYSESPETFWKDKEETSNYSPEPDNNGEDMPQYQIKKSDIDGISDWRNISKSFDDERIGLTDVFGY